MPAAPRAWPAPDLSPLGTPVNLPNAITLGRIALTPLIAWLPFTTSWTVRLIAFLLFTIAAVTDYWDGHLARSRNLVTDLGRLLDPLADENSTAFGLVAPDLFYAAGNGLANADFVLYVTAQHVASRCAPLGATARTLCEGQLTA